MHKMIKESFKCLKLKHLKSKSVQILKLDPRLCMQTHGKNLSVKGFFFLRECDHDVGH